MCRITPWLGENTSVRPRTGTKKKPEYRGESNELPAGFALTLVFRSTPDIDRRSSMTSTPYASVAPLIGRILIAGSFIIPWA